IVDIVWVVAIAAAGAGLLLFGVTLLSVLAGLAVGCVAIFASLVFAASAEREVQRKLAELGAAVGAAGRRDRATQFKAAFAGLNQPVLVASSDGEILGASRGLLALEPRAVEGASI